MKIILLKNVPKVGKKFEIKEVKAGYARNFLLPHQIAMVATKANIRKIEALKAKEKETEQVFEEKFNEISRNAEKFSLDFLEKANSEGKLFGSIDKKEIKKALESHGIKIDKDIKIDLNKPLKKVGRYHINLILGDKKIPLKVQIKGIEAN